jgi:hypothetical protein
LGKRGEAGIFMVGADELRPFAAHQHEEATHLWNAYQTCLLPTSFRATIYGSSVRW